MNDLVSIVIPAYNAAVFIRNCLDSILDQTYPYFEVIVVNDGSKDDTLDILNEYARKDSRIKVFSQKNGGVSAARNTGLQHMSGKFLTCVDADDSLEPNALEDMVHLMTDDVDFVVCSHNQVRFKKVPRYETPRIFEHDEINQDFIRFDRNIWWPWAKLFRTSIIQDNHLGYDTSITFGEDHVFCLLYAKHTKNKVLVSEKVVYNYHYIRGGLCSKFYPDMHKIQKYVLVKLADYFGGADQMPYEYKAHYTAGYIQDCVNYYCAWMKFDDAVEKIKETFEVYSDFSDEKILRSLFSKEQVEAVNNGDFRTFTKDYIKNNPNSTIVRKIKRYGRRFLESMQRVFLGRI